MEVMKNFFELMLLLGLLLLPTNMMVKVGATECKYKSHIYKGLCFSNDTCLLICQKEGFDRGQCEGGNCMCTKACGALASGEDPPLGEDPPPPEEGDPPSPPEEGDPPPPPEEGDPPPPPEEGDPPPPEEGDPPPPPEKGDPPSPPEGGEPYPPPKK